MKWTSDTAALLDRPAGDRQAWFRLVTPALDRDGTVTLPMGVRLENFKRNPVFCWNHPIPKMEEGQPPPPPPPPEAVIGKVVDYDQSEAALDILVEFAPEQANPQAETCYQLVRGGFLRAVSWCGPILNKEPRRIGEADVPHITDVDLWEASLVIVGSNPAALVLERAIRALSISAPPPVAAPVAAPPPPKPAAAPEQRSARTSKPNSQRGAKMLEKKALHQKLAIEGDEPDSKTVRAAAMKYAAETDDDKETRASVMKAVEEHYPDHAEPDGDEAPKEPKEEKGIKGAEAEGDKGVKAAEDDIDKMDEETAKAALRFARRSASLASAERGADARLAAEVDDLVKQGQVENTPERRAEALALHGKGKLIPALRAAGVEPGTFTTGLRLRSGKVGTPTEIETRSAPRRQSLDAEVDKDAKAILDRINNVGADKYLPATKKAKE